MNIMPTAAAGRQGPPLNKDHIIQHTGLPHAETCADDAPDWRDLDEVLEELGLSLRQFRSSYPHAGLDHRGWDGQVIVDANQLEQEEGGERR